MVAFIVLPFTACKKENQAMTELEESSMNFDQENVGPFLERIIKFIPAGFAKPQADAVVQMIEGMSHNEEKEIEFEITYNGSETLFIVRAFMDDIEAPDLYLFGPPGLAKQIDNEMDLFCEELGI